MKWPLRYKSWFLTILGFILSTKIPHSYPIIFNVTFGKKDRRQNIMVMSVTIQNSHHLDNGTCTFNYSKMKFFCVYASSLIETSVIYFQCMFKLNMRTLKLDKNGILLHNCYLPCFGDKEFQHKGIEFRRKMALFPTLFQLLLLPAQTLTIWLGIMFSIFLLRSLQGFQFQWCIVHI